ncbi:MAG: hypothetical protein ABEJ31_12000 [Haloarculaceae archaeon]
MFQDAAVFAGAGIGIATGTQPLSAPPTLVPGIHLRWASAPERGLPRHGTYLLRRRASAGRTKPVSLATDRGRQHVDATHAEFAGTRAAAATGAGGADSSSWVEFTFVDRSYVSRVDVLFDAGDCAGVTITASTDGTAVDAETVGPGAIARQTVSVRGEYVTSLRIEGDLSLVQDVRLAAEADSLASGWGFLTGVDEPLALPLAHPDYPCVGAPATVDGARSMARERIAYGSPDRFAAPRTAASAPGSVDVTADSPLVTGTDTDWRGDAAGGVFQVAGDDAVYVVLEVLAPDRLLLARPYAGASAADRAYSLEPDRFGTLHDALSALVADGPDAGGMAARALPGAVADAGAVTREAGSTTVTGQATAWDDSLAGLGLQVARPTAGTLAPTPGETTVTGRGTDWGERLVGTVLAVGDQRTRYEVAGVADATTLEVDRPYVGPDAPSGGFAYALYERAVERIERVVGPTELELARPHAGASHDDARGSRLVGVAAAGGDAGAGSATLPAQYPLETLAVASVDPAMSQLLGTYWIDETAEPGVAYDYLLVADRTGVVDLLVNALDVGDGDPSGFVTFVEDLLLAAASDYVDAFLLSDLTRGETDPPAPAAPTSVVAYDLPPSTATGTDPDRYAAGLAWERDRVDGRLPSDAPAAYYLWRDDLGDDPGDHAPAPHAYDPVGTEGSDADFLEDAEPILVADGDRAGTVPGWPSAPIHAVDGRRPAGWYSYRVSGVDLFGRHTDRSDPGAWHDPDTDRPATDPTHPAAPGFAVELRARLPPPPPTGVTAAVLDPQDPATDDDAQAQAWWEDNGSQVGLRIRWAWPAAREAAAPETDAFECLVQPGSLNSHPGSVVAVNEGAETIRVTTSLHHTVDPADGAAAPLPAGAFAGTALHVAGAQFTVVDSGGGSGLWVDVLPREGPDGPLVPVAGVDCALAVPAVYSRGTATVIDGDDRVTGTDTGWTDALAGRPLRLAATGETYTVAAVESAERLRLDRPYHAPPARENREAVAYAIDHPASTDYTAADAWAVQVDDVSIAEDLPEARTADGDRGYETIVPAPGADGGAFDPGVGPGESPVVHANVGVCARIDADDGPLVGDVGGPAPVARPHRDPPAPPAMAPLPAELDWATRPDYESKSYYTVRWERPPEGVAVHVYRAMDRTLFRVDWERRHQDGAFALDAGAVAYFPATLRGEDPAERQRRSAIETALTTDLDDAVSFAAAATVYDALEPDALQTLAALPGNEAAFVQLTAEPLTAAAAPNVRGPDFEPGDPGPGTLPGVDGVPDSMPPGEDLCAYLDAFDGCARNRYVYRLGTVDAAHNRGRTLGDPTPPTRARDGVAPETPVVTAITAGHPDDAEAGDRRLTLRWNVVRSPDLAAYRVYRTADADAVRDVRLMDAVATLSIPIQTDGDPLVGGRRDGAAIVWTDDDRAAGVDWHYRVLAVDDADNASTPSSPVAGRAFDTTPPTPPTPTAEWVRVGPDSATQPYGDPTPADEVWRPAVRLAWAAAAGQSVLVEAAPGPTGNGFEPRSAWLTDETLYLDAAATPTEAVRYRLRVLDERGRQATSPTPVAVQPAGGNP